MKAAIIILTLAASPAFAATEYLCDGITGKTMADGSLIDSTVKTSAAALHVFDMGDRFVIGTTDGKIAITSPQLNSRGMSVEQGAGFAKDAKGFYVQTPGTINAAMNCKPLVKS